MIDFEVPRCSRTCAATERKLEPGEKFYSVLAAQGSEMVRKDFSAQAWQGPPEDVLAWWQSRVPESDAKKTKLAPNDVLLELFDQLADHREKEDVRYVLALLLVRRRVMRLEDGAAPREFAAERPTLTVFCPRREESYEIPERPPAEDRIDAIQQYLSELLYADAK